ncbi:MAG TPA: hypothetical protein VFQ73_04230 [Flavisolibacter sp.]|nr:hypothetical protein [Flavisolibacter sp.]
MKQDRNSQQENQRSSQISEQRTGQNQDVSSTRGTGRVGSSSEELQSDQDLHNQRSGSERSSSQRNRSESLDISEE